LKEGAATLAGARCEPLTSANIAVAKDDDLFLAMMIHFS
jgi:hypothetical protein